MVPDPQKTSVGMEYFCTEGDDIWKMPDAELIDMASRELSQLGLAKAADVTTDGFVVHQPKAYPIYDPEYRNNLKVIRDFIETIDNLQAIGRNGMHRYNNMDHSMPTGMLAAENILGAKHSIWDVNEEEEYLEEDKRVRADKVNLDRVLVRSFDRMDKLAFATAAGSVSGLLFFFATIWLIVKGGEVVGPNLQLLSQYFVGYTVTMRGALVAFGYSFLWGFLFGWLFTYLRNFFLAYYIYRVNKKAAQLKFREFVDHY
jgi:hypothetical protein